MSSSELRPNLNETCEERLEDPVWNSVYLSNYYGEMSILLQEQILCTEDKSLQKHVLILNFLFIFLYQLAALIVALLLWHTINTRLSVTGISHDDDRMKYELQPHKMT